AVEVFVEKDQIAPVGIGLKLLHTPKHGTAAVVALQEYAGHAARRFSRPLPQSEHPPRPGGALYLEILAQVVMELLQRFDQQVVHRKPDRTAPVRVAAEQPGGGLSRFVVRAVFHAVYAKPVRVVAMELREATNAVRREKLAFVQHELQNAAQLVLVGNGQ